jgi:anti-sigma factor (TIGR02949 family)
MMCHEFEARLDPYVDRELGVDEMASADAHVAHCLACRQLAEREREFRDRLRRQPREAAPSELRARIVADIRRQRWRLALRPWLLASALGAAAALLVVSLLPSARPATPSVAEFVDKHIAYAQVERPAELTSTSAVEIREWFRARAGLRVTVPDYTPAGIHLVGARLAESHERKAAYLLYQKGTTLLSVFIVPATPRDAGITGTRVSFRGSEYLTSDWKGYRTVSWTDEQAVYGLMSMLDYEALLECADRLRVERATETRL